jgi:endonuclease/exonuclease/phosphatase family metal-dependent hydrolase
MSASGPLPTLVAVAVAMVASGSEPHDNAESGEVFRALQMNLCNSGLARCYKGGSAVREAEYQIKTLRPDLVTLNEICDDDLPMLSAALAANAETYFSAAYQPQGGPVKCNNGADYGNAIILKSTGLGTRVKRGLYATQQPQAEQRSYLCVDTGLYHACASHLSTDKQSALGQCKELVQQHLPRLKQASASPRIVIGDFNLKDRRGTVLGSDLAGCAPASFKRHGDGRVQHLLASEDVVVEGTVIIDMKGTTDHPALLVELRFPASDSD